MSVLPDGCECVQDHSIAMMLMTNLCVRNVDDIIVVDVPCVQTLTVVLIARNLTVEFGTETFLSVRGQ